MTSDTCGPAPLEQLCPACKDAVTAAEAEAIRRFLSIERPNCPACRSAFPVQREAT